jgi:cytochrome P450
LGDTAYSDVDLIDPASYREGLPHERFTELRAKGAVHRHPPRQVLPGEPEVSFWSVVRHAEVQQANRDWETFTATESVTIAASPADRQGHMLVSMDPPDHTRLRRLITAGFTPRMIGRLEEHIERRTGVILDAAEEAGTCDFVRDIAYQLPMHVIADIVGIPEDDRPWIFERTDLMLRALDPGNDLTVHDQRAAQIDLFGYAQQLTERKRSEPADDVWTLIAQAELTDDDGTVHRLEGLELEMFFVILAVAGSETTRNALSQGVMALLDHPTQLAELRATPELVSSAADEIIRWASPVLFFGRTATRDVVLGGTEIARGDRVILWYPSANRDERAFEDPFRFDIHRQPNPHVSFGGGGPHYCLGASLAKKEVQVLTAALFDRFDVEVTGDAEWAGGGPVHNVGVSVDHLPVHLTARR